MQMSLAAIRNTKDRADPALQPTFRKALLASTPGLRAFAISLSGNVDRADDLVQDTLLRAMANIGSFQPGTNMMAWLVTILRNQFRSEYRASAKSRISMAATLAGRGRGAPQCRIARNCLQLHGLHVGMWALKWDRARAGKELLNTSC